MLSTSTQFEHIASLVTSKVAELLYAPVFVMDGQGKIITSSESHQIGKCHSFDAPRELETNFLRIPLQHETGIGEIIVGEPSDRASIPPRLAQALVELVISQTRTQSTFASQHELKNQFMNDLLQGCIQDEAVILQRASSLGIDLNPPRAVILIDATEYICVAQVPDEQQETEQKRRSHMIISSIVSFFHLPSDTICADLGEGKVAVLKASDSKNLDPWVDCQSTDANIANSIPPGTSSSSWANLTALKRAADALLLRLRNDTGTAINIGIGRYHPGIRGLARSYEDAHAALALGNKLQTRNQVYCLGELGIAAFVGVANESTKFDLAKYLLSPLDHEPELLATLDVFFAENCCPSSTAKKLSIHRNTLSYRLDKIASFTGLEPRKFDDAVQIRLCLLLRSLQHHEKKSV